MPPGVAYSEVSSAVGPHHFTTRNVRCVIPAPSITRVLSSSIGSALWSNNRTPSPSRTGTRSTCISSRSPDLMHCCTRFAPITPTSLSPAAAFACATALSRPSVTNVKDDPRFTHSCGTEWVRTKTGTPNGCPPPHPRVRSNVLRPVTKAPVVALVSRRYSAVCGETLNTISVPGSLYSVSPPMYQAKSRSPPLPIGASSDLFGPAINPSSDVACPVRTFPMASFSYSVHPPLGGSQLSWALLPDVRMGSQPEAERCRSLDAPRRRPRAPVPAATAPPGGWALLRASSARPSAGGGGRRPNAVGGGGGEGQQGGGPPRPAGAGQLELLGGVLDGLGGDPGGGLVDVASQVTQHRVVAELARRLPTLGELDLQAAVGGPRQQPRVDLLDGADARHHQ